MKFDSSYFWSANYAKGIIFSLLALFGLLIIFEVGDLFTFHNTLLPPTEVISPTVVPEKTDTHVTDVATTLFGKYVPVNLKDSEVKESKLKIEIIGIIFANNAKDSQVILQTAEGEENIYSIGESIPGNAVIKRIMANGILVEHNGALESVSFPKNGLEFEPPPKPLIKD